MSKLNIEVEVIEPGKYKIDVKQDGDTKTSTPFKDSDDARRHLNDVVDDFLDKNDGPIRPIT